MDRQSLSVITIVLLQTMPDGSSGSLVRSRLTFDLSTRAPMTRGRIDGTMSFVHIWARDGYTRHFSAERGDEENEESFSVLADRLVPNLKFRLTLTPLSHDSLP